MLSHLTIHTTFPFVNVMKSNHTNRQIHVFFNFFFLYTLCLQNMARTHSLPTPSELNNMKDDLSFKTQEMKHSEMTAGGLARGNFIISFVLF